MIYTYKINSPLGMLTLASCGKNLTGLWIEGQKYFAGNLKNINEDIIENKSLPIFAKAAKWLKKYFDGKNPEINFPLYPSGSGFRKKVWDILCRIPYGQVITYGDIAKKIGKKTGEKRMSAQAVGGAVGHNPISIIIPCHRVVGADGNLTGYAGGINLKIALLKLENVPMERFYVPKKGSAL